jgi:hypothetical protein
MSEGQVGGLGTGKINPCGEGCPLPPREALRRAMMVEPPMEWKKPAKISKPSKKKAAR